MSSKITGAVPNSLLTQKSRSGSRSKSAKNAKPALADQTSHSKSLAANRAILTQISNTREHTAHLGINN